MDTNLLINKDDLAYCGLNCKICKEKFEEIRESARILNQKLEAVNFKEMAKAIPFMNRKYQGYKKAISFFTEGKCPGCHNGGGNPFCGIRKCAKKNDFTTCAECETDYPCKRFKMLFRVHEDNEIQNAIGLIKQGGIDLYVNSVNRNRKLNQ